MTYLPNVVRPPGRNLIGVTGGRADPETYEQLRDDLLQAWGTASRPDGKVIWAVFTVAFKTRTHPSRLRVLSHRAVDGRELSWR